MEEPFPPSSPGSSPVQLADCLDDLLKFIISSSIEETLEIDLGLSKEYCSDLLKVDIENSNFDDSDNSRGIPLYPLYKRLASALHRCLTFGDFLRTSNEMMLIKGDASLKQKEDEWNKMVRDEGSKLVKMLKTVDFELHVQEPFLTQLRVGLKSIEGRCAVGNYNRIGPGSLLLFNKFLLLEVQDVKWYASFSEMLNAESLEKVLPGVKTIEEGVQIYRKFYTEEKENSNGVVAICVSKPASQPYISLAAIVSGLSYEGIGSLLGLMHTEGTIPDALPPLKTALLSSFMMPHNPHVNGSSLTEGARALAKHVNRGGNRWWGSFDGNGKYLSYTPFT
ncbi:ASCH domain [Macleaya cordata]|uniref:ASCH domain n=1 Tax=Macleaya cordata TaxID=56857 RepID=A0A200PXS6_MACCD|nr:ASCH domain [Macleaya cordata]